MADLTTRKNKHLTFDDRHEIQMCLDRGMNFKAIAARIGKDQTTISKEIKKHLKTNPDDGVKRMDENGVPVSTPPCPLLLRAPFVCNGCKKRRVRCAFRKQLYLAKNAQQEYELLLSEAREGIPLNKDEFYEIDAILSAGIRKGQHLYHIVRTNELRVSMSTVYRHFQKGYFSVSKIDLPRVVKFKARRLKRGDFVPKSAKIGKTYQDFLSHIEEHDISSWVEMDTVIGRIGGKVIMTFNFTFCNFMFGLLLDNKSADCAAQKIRELKKRLVKSGVRFGDVFPLLLTDNGGEFANISAFTVDANGDIESDLFFCDPYQSSQKAKVEKNHTLFRDIVPKGKSFDSFSQQTVNLIMSHTNGVKRKSLNGKSSYEVFAFTHGAKIAALLGIKEIAAADVIQSPSLLKSTR